MVTVVMVLVTVIVVGMIGCTNANQPAKGALKVGFSIPLTGAAAEKGAPIGQGQLDAMTYINDELGGVAGNKIDVNWYDTNYDSQKATSIVKKLMEDNCLLFTVVSSKDMTASKEIANRAGFPGLVCFTSTALTQPPEHIYAQVPGYGDDWVAFSKYYLANLWKGQGKPKMALMLLSNSTGYDVRDAAKAMADKLGIDIVAVEEHAVTTISETQALKNIQSKNPDVLFISSTPAPTAIILKNAKDLGMIPGLTVASAHAGFTKVLLDIAGKDICEGLYGIYPTVNWGDNVPGMAKMTEYAKARHPEFIGNSDYIVGWSSSLINAEILRKAIEAVGSDTLIKGGKAAWPIIESSGFGNLKNFNAQGLLGTVDFSDPKDKRGSKSVKIFKVKDGVMAPITDWIETPYLSY
jgi:branched-chain amino acid transport system substrate-binding protein